MTPVPIVCFSDVLCIWAYIAQLRVDALKAAFGDQIRFEPRFCSVFGDTARKISTAWKDKGRYEGFNAHIRHVAGQFPEAAISPDLWLTVRPASSTGPQLFLKAIQLLEAEGGCAEGAFEAATWAFRRAFFAEGRDIGVWRIQGEIAHATGLDLAPVEALILDGRAFAALASDYADAVTMGIQGSPSFVLNEGRQKLYGNVGYRVLDANIRELLREPAQDQASWC
ncbi:putative DsbA family dithiol-disulfide isomerase [Caulobacter ginsengisoli]|uniref:DsbA family dithiol-disulfide isomerase n=1 Tax=Caulobacter ginsengisoli TaxID=400775 RepID=A0ABU0INY9_9CAUL|nr:DsbA family protein [Caulobacter ginsengisoli]MDQ0463717.1 putative DsbA family dithiol-disulfide isomerase [Caulobacter ginsengisoli]